MTIRCDTCKRTLEPPVETIDIWIFRTRFHEDEHDAKTGESAELSNLADLAKITDRQGLETDYVTIGPCCRDSVAGAWRTLVRALVSTVRRG